MLRRPDVVVCEETGGALAATLRALLGHAYDVKSLNKHALATQPWPQSCALVVTSCNEAAERMRYFVQHQNGKMLGVGPKAMDSVEHAIANCAFNTNSSSGATLYTIQDQCVAAHCNEQSETVLVPALKALGIDVAQSNTPVFPTPIYVLASNALDAQIAARHGIRSDWTPEVCKEWSFDPALFFTQLGTATDAFGSAMLYAECTTSTQTLLQQNPELCSALPYGALFVTGHQTAGRGRASNAWLSSTRCLQFTAVIDLPAQFSAALVQHLAALAMVEYLRAADSALSVWIKWPNDIYTMSEHGKDGFAPKKLGGILVTRVPGGRFLVGIGINVRDTPWTRALNEAALKIFTKEEVLAGFCNAFSNRLRRAICLCTVEHPAHGFPFEDYYAHWIHSLPGHDIVRISNSGDELRIDGIDSSGYLVAVDGSGKVHCLEPDGNSFDITTNMVTAKV